jgi:hypothetical protein
MRNIKINEKQDKEIRKIIKENMLNTNTALDGGVKTSDGGSAKIDYTSGNQNDSPQTQLTKAANVQDKMKVNGVNTPVETELNVGGTDRSVTVGDKVTENKCESFIISKKQLDEIRLKKLKENSEVVKIKNFLK